MRYAAIALILLGRTGFAQECPPPNSELSQLIQTDQYWFEAHASDGAVGDIVPVTISLHSTLPNPGWLAMDLVLCHDPNMVEIVGEPIYGEEFLSLLGVGGVFFLPVNEIT